MLEALEISNFQSHETTKLELDPGVNVILGPSDNGKSAVLRALFWLIQNKPDGLGFVSHWNLTEKGTLKKATAVTLVYDNGKKLIRRRTKDLNQYEVEGKTLDAVGRDVPPDVEHALDITEINIQRQLDPHFLLSDSAGEVARIFNRTIRLDDIDKLLALVEQKKRATKNAGETAALELTRVLEEIAKLNWIDDTEVLIAKANALVASVGDTRKTKETLAGLLVQYSAAEQESVLSDTGTAEADVEELQELGRTMTNEQIALDDLRASLDRFRGACDDVQSLPDIAAIEEMVSKVEAHQTAVAKAKDQRVKLRETLSAFQVAQQLLVQLGDVPDIDTQLEAVETTEASIVKAIGTVKSIRDSLSGYANLEVEVASLNKEIEALEAELPDVCPLCNGTGKLKE